MWAGLWRGAKASGLAHPLIIRLTLPLDPSPANFVAGPGRPVAKVASPCLPSRLKGKHVSMLCADMGSATSLL